MTAAKQVRAQYTQEFKLEAVRQVKAGQAIAVVAKVLGIPKASLSNWVRLSAKGVLSGTGDKPVAVTAEQMELARLRAEGVLALSIKLPEELLPSPTGGRAGDEVVFKEFKKY